MFENFIKNHFLKFFPIFYTDSDTNIVVKSSNLCRKPSGKRYRSRMTLYRGPTLCIAPECGLILYYYNRYDRNCQTNVCHKNLRQKVVSKICVKPKICVNIQNRFFWYQTALNRLFLSRKSKLDQQYRYLYSNPSISDFRRIQKNCVKKLCQIRNLCQMD